MTPISTDMQCAPEAAGEGVNTNGNASNNTAAGNAVTNEAVSVDLNELNENTWFGIGKTFYFSNNTC